MYFCGQNLPPGIPSNRSHRVNSDRSEFKCSSTEHSTPLALPIGSRPAPFISAATVADIWRSLSTTTTTTAVPGGVRLLRTLPRDVVEGAAGEAAAAAAGATAAPRLLGGAVASQVTVASAGEACASFAAAAATAKTATAKAAILKVPVRHTVGLRPVVRVALITDSWRYRAGALGAHVASLSAVVACWSPRCRGCVLAAEVPRAETHVAADHYQVSSGVAPRAASSCSYVILHPRAGSRTTAQTHLRYVACRPVAAIRAISGDVTIPIALEAHQGGAVRLCMSKLSAEGTRSRLCFICAAVCFMPRAATPVTQYCRISKLVIKISGSSEKFLHLCVDRRARTVLDNCHTGGSVARPAAGRAGGAARPATNIPLATAGTAWASGC